MKENAKIEEQWSGGSPAWEALLSRALMSLDDAGMEQHEKRKGECDRRLARHMEKSGAVASPYDWFMVREVLVEYDKCGRMDEALRMCNARESECVAAKSFDEDVRLVWGYVDRQVRERMCARALDIAQDAQRGLHRAVTEDDCKLNPKALKIALERTVPELYGGPGRAAADEDGEEVSRERLPMNGGIMIKIIGDAAEKLLGGPKDGGRPGGVFVDV